jgi:hypothetical protein
VQQALYEGDVQDAQRRGDASAPHQRLVHVRVARILPDACVAAQVILTLGRGTGSDADLSVVSAPAAVGSKHRVGSWQVKV